MADYFHVKNEFGAIGNGSADDTAALQAALDAAFGPASAPRGNAGALKPIYFPRGGYRITRPLVVTNVWGAKIFGDGPLASSIHLDNISAPVNAEGFVPVLWLNGFNFGSIKDISFSGPTDPDKHSTVCMWWGPDGLLGSTNAHGCNMENVHTYGTSWGVVHGSAASQANSEHIYTGCYFGGAGTGHEQVGFFASGMNTLNIRLRGGGAGGCGTGIKTNNSATITLIDAPAFDNNFQDISISQSSPCTISGIRTESAAFLETGSSPTTVMTCAQATIGGAFSAYTAGPAATFTGTISGTTLTAENLAGKLIAGMVVRGAGIPVGQSLASPVVGKSGVWNLNMSQLAIASEAMTAGGILISPGGALGGGMVIKGSDGAHAMTKTRLLYKPLDGTFLGSISHAGSISTFTLYPLGTSGEVYPGQNLINSGATTAVAPGQNIGAQSGPLTWALAVGFPSQPDVGSVQFPVDMKTQGNGLYLISDVGDFGNNVGTSSSLAPFVEHPVFLECHGSCAVTMDGCSGEADSVIIADQNSTLWMRNCSWLDQVHGGISADLFTDCKAIIGQYDNLFTGNPTVANLPAPKQGMAGLEMFVIDYSGPLTWGASVLGKGGGKTVAKVWCTGADWLIG